MTNANPTASINAAVDQLFGQLFSALKGNADFEAALAAGEINQAAADAIGKAFEVVFARNERVANVLMTDDKSREALTRFWFARSYADVHAADAYAAAFKFACSAA